MTVVSGLDISKGLNLILHSTGGSVDSAAAIVTYLRGRFPSLYVYIPQIAMSAAALICLAADRLVMGQHSALGPIDPQMLVGGNYQPAHAIISQYKKLEADAMAVAPSIPAMIQFYSSMLPTYGPGYLQVAEYFTERSKQLAEQWLGQFMFRDDPAAASKASHIAEYMGNHGNFNSHACHIFRDALRSVGLLIDDLETEPNEIQDWVLTAYHAATIELQMTESMKLIQNHLGIIHPR